MNVKQYMEKKWETAKDSRAARWCSEKIEKLRQKRISKPTLIFGGAAVLIIAAALYFQLRVSHSYEVISSAQNEDTQSSGYAQLGNRLLKYGDDGVSLLDQYEKVLWSQTYEMNDPDIDVYEDYGVIYDKKGTSMYVVNKEKPIGSIEVKFPILKAKVAANGAVAVILEDGEKTWINYYASDGSVIAENQTAIESPGYPADIAVAPGGESILVTYFCLDGAQVSSYVASYNFGDAGQNKVDNIAAEFHYENTLVPQVAYMSKTTAVAFRDDGFSVYDGGSVPTERVKKEINDEIVSTFYNDKYIGLVFKGGKEDEKYTMKLYDISGKERVSQGFDMEYKDIRISGDRIILYNDTRVCIYNFNGRLKFDGDMSDEGAVKSVFKVASNRYILVSENGINTIKIK